MNGFERHGGAAADEIAKAVADADDPLGRFGVDVTGEPRPVFYYELSDGLTSCAFSNALAALAAALKDYEIARALADCAPRNTDARLIARHKFTKIQPALAAAQTAARESGL